MDSISILTCRRRTAIYHRKSGVETSELGIMKLEDHSALQIWHLVVAIIWVVI